MSSIADELAAVLSTVRRPGDFFASGTAEMLAPRLEVADIGQVALPLLPIQAEQLVAVAERAPYGRGEDTLTDTAVRRTWQIDAERVRIEGKHWARTLDAILARVAEGLGVSEPVEAEFYKLLIYDQGSFFVSHRDTEKAPGMFATLVLVLPSTSAGGELVLRHKGREARLDLRCEEPSEVAFAAFYADCVHEVLPVTSGCRLVLVYNLVRRGQGQSPQPPSYLGEEARVATLSEAWAARKQSPDDDAPEKLIYPLEHAYTPAELGFKTLKGADAAVAKVVVAAAQRSGCDVHLALVSVEESGSAEHTAYFGSGRRWSEPEEDAFKVDEVCDRFVAAAEWRRPDGDPSPLTVIPVEEEEFSPPGAFDDLDPDEVHFHEATGNEGASFERTYRRAALVLWPRERLFAVINQAGLKVTLPYLDELLERWTASREGRGSPLWRQAHDLSGHMLSTWPMQQWHPQQGKIASDVAQMLLLLTRLEDTARIDVFLSDITARGGFDRGDGVAILGALRLLPAGRAAFLIERFVAGAAESSLAACGDLLARAAAAPAHAKLIGAATILVDALPGDPARISTREPWRRGPGVAPGVVTDLFTALALIDAPLAERAADHILAWPKTYGLDAVLVPSVRELLASDTTKDFAAVQRLRVAGLAHLNARVARPLEAPRDWSRANTLECKCVRCSELSRYLADPEKKIWVFRAAEADRGHVAGTIRQARCDLDLTTERRGRPYSLVCTKNQASYERRVTQRKRDLADLERLKM
jgi:predicted 2-oxoglutarate/Fe(II)-dependent dioxygenase YbiX